ncbi:MAG: ATP cone domain-containing protein, partial [Patescibacteria group bacterium]
MKQIKKRNGSIVDFETTKITDALRKAFQSCDVAITEEGLEALTVGVLGILEAKYGEEAVPSVEMVQD